ncbi:hypothetical protein BJV74DRAFT_488994 [Russula compacta]|nr:hypothetical protein BJV74DRAFT_488994 [Russula compacta]
MALNVAEGVNTVRAMVHTVAVVLLALVAGCTGFVTSIAALSLTWLVPSARKSPPEMTERPQRRTRPVPPRAPPQSAEVHKTESVPRPEPVRHISFDERVPMAPSSAPASAQSSPGGRFIPLPRCKDRTPQSGVISLPSTITAQSSPLSSAETLTETPAEVKRTFSSRLSRALRPSRGRQLSRCTTMVTMPTSSSSATVVSEFGQHIVSGKSVTLPISDSQQPPNVTERGRFGFRKKSKTIDKQHRSCKPNVRVAVGPLRCHSHHRPPSHQIFIQTRSLPLSLQTPLAPYHQSARGGPSTVV